MVNSRGGRGGALIVLLALGACEVEAEDPGADASLTLDAASTADSAPEWADAALDAAEPFDPGPGGRWLIVQDTTTGLLIGEHAGTDVDAVTWRCPDGSLGAGRDPRGRRDAEAAGDDERAAGTPDGPCDPPDVCAATLGPQGWLALAIDAAPGCEAIVHEVADFEDETFEVWLCPAPALDGECRGPLFGGRDGEGATGTLP